MSEINLKLKTYDELTFEISRLNTDKYLLEQKLQQKENIIKEVREILQFHLLNPSGTKNGWHIDIWNDEDINKLNEHLEILDKENK